MHSAMTTTDGSGAMFDRIAHRYDLLNTIISLGIDRRWRRELVAALKLEPGDRVLDLATGTGAVAFDILRRHPDVTVLGTDPSVKMLGIAERKSARLGLDSRLQLSEGVAESIDLPDDSVNAITMAFGIRNAADREAALRETRRVLRPGGRVGILELSEPRRGLLGPLARFHVHHVVPTLGALLSGKREYRYLQRSIAAFPGPEEFCELMSAAGLEVEAARPLTFGVAHLYLARVGS